MWDPGETGIDISISVEQSLFQIVLYNNFIQVLW